MELIPHNLSLDFVGKRKFFTSLSLTINAAILIAVAIFGLEWGVDFAGGAELEVGFADAVDPGEVRVAMEKAGFPEASVQVFGPPSDHTFLIRIGRISLLSQAEADKARQAFQAKFGEDLASFDFNPELGDKIDLRFKKPVVIGDVQALFDQAGIKLTDLRAMPFGTPEELAKVGRPGWQIITSGIADKVAAGLADAKLSKAELKRVEFVGPQVGKQLRNKGILSVLYAMLGILVYVAFRFDFKFAPGGVIALIHDVIVVLGYYVISRREFNLTSVAVMLTIIGYSINDTIVVYDRIRENMTKRTGMALAGMVNVSINETLSRTILTSSVTALSLVGLLLFGVGQIWDFAAAMLLGIITGTYSSIYIATPITIWFEDMMGKGGSGGSQAKAA